MGIFARLLLVLGVACITYGVARSQIVPEVLSKQEKHFDRFFAEHTEASTNILQDVVQLRRRVMLSGGLYAGWPQAIGPVAFGLMLVAIGYYIGQKKRDSKRETAA